MKQINWGAIQEGEWVQLKRSYNNTNVPARLEGVWGEVVRRNKAGNLVVQPNGGIVGDTVTAQISNIKDHSKQCPLM